MRDSGAARWRSGVTASVIALGCALRILQLAAAPSLWVDELAVVRNITHLPLTRLLSSPLEWGQVAPSGLLAVGALLSVVVPDADWVFRVVPFFSSLATLPVVYLLARKVVGPWPAVVATGLVAFSPPAIGLSTVAKQYASDVFVAAALVYGGVKCISGEIRRPFVLAGVGLLGGVLLFFSFPGVLVAFVIAGVLSASWATDREPGWMVRILRLGVPLGTCAGVVTYLALRARSPETTAFLSDYWAAGFPGSVAGAPAWMVSQLAGVYETGFLAPYPRTGEAGFWSALLLGLGFVGAAALLTRQRKEALIVLAPVVASLLAATAHIYPLAGRISVFLVPTLALLAVAGSVTLEEAVRRRARSVAPVMGVAPLLPIGLALFGNPPPFVFEHTRPLMRALAEQKAPGDVVYSYYAANQAVDYYGGRFGVTDWVPGACSRDDPRSYLRQLDALRGHPRVWVVFTHALPELGEDEAMLGYLRTIGHQRKALLDQLDRFQTSAYLFDLSDPAALARATADDYPMERRASRRTCGLGPASTWEPPQALRLDP